MKRILPFLLILISSPFFGQTYQTWRSEATNNIWQTNDNWWNFPNGSPIVFGQQEWDNNHQTSHNLLRMLAHGDSYSRAVPMQRILFPEIK